VCYTGYYTGTNTFRGAYKVSYIERKEPKSLTLVYTLVHMQKKKTLNILFMIAGF
jgi:hypothetical protein